MIEVDDHDRVARHEPRDHLGPGAAVGGLGGQAWVGGVALERGPGHDGAREHPSAFLGEELGRSSSDARTAPAAIAPQHSEHADDLAVARGHRCGDGERDVVALADVVRTSGLEVEHDDGSCRPPSAAAARSTNGATSSARMAGPLAHHEATGPDRVLEVDDGRVTIDQIQQQAHDPPTRAGLGVVSPRARAHRVRQRTDAILGAALATQECAAAPPAKTATLTSSVRLGDHGRSARTQHASGQAGRARVQGRASGSGPGDSARTIRNNTV